jgi:Tfp pilus assembly protein PilO
MGIERMWSLRSQITWFNRIQWTLAGAVVLMSAGFYLFAYRPQTRRQEELRASIVKQQHELDSSQSQTSVLPSVASEVKLLRVRLEKFKALPRQQELPQFIRDIAQLGQQAALKRFSLTPGVPSRDDRFNELPVQLTFEGDFVNVFSFLRHTEDLQRLTRVRGMSVKSKDKLGQVKVQLSMNIYFAAE